MSAYCWTTSGFLKMKNVNKITTILSWMDSWMSVEEDRTIGDYVYYYIVYVVPD